MPHSTIPIGINDETPANYYLSASNQKVTFLEEFSPAAILGEIADQKLLSVIHGHMVSRYQDQKEIPPLHICVKAGKENFSFLHVIKNNRLIDTHIHHYFNKNTQAEILHIFLKTLLKDINTLFENENIALAFEYSNYTLVFAAKTKYDFLPFKNILCVFYLENDSRLVLLTLYTIPDRVFEEVKKGSTRYTPINPFIVNFSKNTQVFWQNLTQRNDNSGTEISASNENSCTPSPTSSTTTTYSIVDQTLNDNSMVTNPEILPTLSYPEAILDNLLEENENTRHLILRNNKFYSRIIRLLDINNEQISNYKIHSKIEEANLHLEKIKKFTIEVKSHTTNLNFDIYNRYFDAMKEVKITFIYISATGIQIANETDQISANSSHRTTKIRKIYQSVTANKVDKADNEKEKLILEKTNLLEINYNTLIENTKLIEEKLAQIFNETHLLRLSYLKNICFFLNAANNKKLNPFEHEGHYKLFQELCADEKLEEVCRDTDNLKSYEFFMLLSSNFYKNYKDVWQKLSRISTLS